MKRKNNKYRVLSVLHCGHTQYIGKTMGEDERLQLCIQELSMMTGVVNKDIDYLLYLLLKDGILFEEEKKPHKEDNDMAVSTFEDWFDKL